eukprot:gene14028-16315_t
MLIQSVVGRKRKCVGRILVDLTEDEPTTTTNFTSPVQPSVALHNTNTGVPVPPPLANAELVQPATKRARRLAAEVHLLEVQAQLVVGNADATDVGAARVYQSQVVYNAERLSPVERNLSPFAVAVAAAIMPAINAQFAQINAQFAQINAQFALMTAQSNAQFAQMHAMHTNRFSKHPGDTIVPLPVLPQPGVPVPLLPACYPATRQQLMDLSSPDVNTLLEYYGEPTNGTLNNRRAQFMAFLGMPPTRNVRIDNHSDESGFREYVTGEKVRIAYARYVVSEAVSGLQDIAPSIVTDCATVPWRAARSRRRSSAPL